MHRLRMHCKRFATIFTFPSSLQKTYATAVYDNLADSPEELAFRRGDILEVLERDTNGMVGWWLCMLRGRKVSQTVRQVGGILK